MQILMIAEPFHRMFSLDNIAIQYPHAEIERVSVSTSPPNMVPPRQQNPPYSPLFFLTVPRRICEDADRLDRVQYPLFGDHSADHHPNFNSPYPPLDRSQPLP